MFVRFRLSVGTDLGGYRFIPPTLLKYEASQDQRLLMLRFLPLGIREQPVVDRFYGDYPTLFDTVGLIRPCHTRMHQLCLLIFVPRFA